MPAYNAEKTLVKTCNEVLEEDIVDLVLLVDDASRDNTVAQLNISLRHLQSILSAVRNTVLDAY